MAGQFSTVLRGRMPLFAGSDIFKGSPVVIASQGAAGAPGTTGWTVLPALSSAQKPIGIARDNAAAGGAVDIYDDGNVTRILPGAGASISLPAYIGVVGATPQTHPISGVVGSQPLLGPVTGTPSVAVGASATPVWAVGSAWEGAALGDQSAFRIEPRLLSGLVTA